METFNLQLDPLTLVLVLLYLYRSTHDRARIEQAVRLDPQSQLARGLAQMMEDAANGAAARAAAQAKRNPYSTPITFPPEDHPQL